MTEISRTYVTIVPRTDRFKEDAEAQLKRKKPRDVEVAVTADTKAAADRLDVLKGRLDELRLRTTDASVRLDGDEKALRQISTMQAALGRLDRVISSPRVRVDGISSAETRIAALNLQLDKLDARTASVGGGGRGGRGSLLSRLAEFAEGGGGFFGGLGLAGVAGGAAALPLGAGALGVGASFLTPAVAGTTGLGLFAAAAKSSISDTEKKLKALDKLNQQIKATPATTTSTTAGASAASIRAAQLRLQAAEQRLAVSRASGAAAATVSSEQASVVSAQSSLARLQGSGGTTTRSNAAYEKLLKQRADLLKQMDPAQRRAAKSLEALEEDWKHFQKALEPESFRLLATGTQIADKALTALRPSVKAVGDEVDTLAKRADRALSDPFWQHFFGDFLTREAPRAVDSLGTTIGNVVTGFARLSERFAPLGHDLERELVAVSGRFDEWTQGGGPQRFLDLVDRDGPVAARALEGIGSALGGLAKGFEPIGRIELQALTPVLNFIGDLGEQHPEVITALGGAYLSIAGGLKAIAAVKGISSVVATVRGLGTGKGGTLGGFSGSLTNPVPVYVTNPHGGPAGGTPAGGGKTPPEEPVVPVGGGGSRVRPPTPVEGPVSGGVLNNLKRFGRSLGGSAAGLLEGAGLAELPLYAVGGQSDVRTPDQRRLLDQYEAVIDKQKQTADGIERLKAEYTQLQTIARNASADEAGFDQAMLTATAAALRSVGALAPQFEATGRDLGGDLGSGLIQGIEARIPHATVAGKLLVQRTVKQMRLAAEANSPSRATMRLGQDLADGLLDGFTNSNVFYKLGAETQRGLMQLSQTAQAAVSYRSGVRSNLLGYANISGIGQQTDSFGSPLGGANTISYLRGKRNDLRTFTKLYVRLRREGLDKRLLDQFAQEGPDAVPAMRDLLAGGTHRIERADRLERQIGHFSTRVARQATDAQYGREIYHELQRLPHRLEGVLVRALRHQHFDVSVRELSRHHAKRVLSH